MEESLKLSPKPGESFREILCNKKELSHAMEMLPTTHKKNKKKNNHTTQD